ncbi:YwmB family TATA-box binding protein [Paenibacillus sp. FSL K6-0276]|uniref:YwmB family TATA-box binding protein n=1 Tax=Paenibacillus sp. FSL K6-0276 TaxID=2921450 RepID=UPI0030EC42BC
MLKTMLNNGTKKGTLFILLFVCCTVALLVNFQSVKAKSIALDEVVSQASVTSELNGSLMSLIDLGKKTTVSDSPLHIVLKWQGAISGYNDPSVEVAKLCARLGLTVPSGIEEEGRMTYRSTAAKPYESRLSLFWSELEEGNSYVIVTLDTADLQNEASFQVIADEVSTMLEQSNIKAEWNVSLQGIAEKQGGPEEVFSQTEGLLKEQFETVSEKESYKDVATVSRTYSIPDLKRSIVSGIHSVSAQIAVHKEDQQGTNRITIGFPLITIEY